jgi:hypothetical protein
MEYPSKLSPSKGLLIFCAVITTCAVIATASLWAGIEGLIADSANAQYPITLAYQHFLTEFLWLGGGLYLGLRTLDAFLKGCKGRPWAYIRGSSKFNRVFGMLSFALFGLVLFLAYVGVVHQP